MADIAPYLWLMAPQYISVEGTIDIEGDYIHVVATFDWTSFLPAMHSNVDHIWVALPRDTYNAADTASEFPFPAEGFGEYIWAYGVEETEYFPELGYIGRLTINGDDHVMQLIRGECYDFLTIRDFFPSGIHASGDMDLKWKRQAGTELSTGRGATTAGGAQGGMVRTRRRRPS